MSDPANSYSGQAWLGVGPPLVIGVAIFLVGVVVMLVWRVKDARFWEERAGVADPDVVPGRQGAGRPIPTDWRAEMAVVLGYDESPGADAALDAAI